MIPPPEQPPEPAESPHHGPFEPREGSPAAKGGDEVSSPLVSSEQSAQAGASGPPLGDPQPGCGSIGSTESAQARLLDELVGVHVERENLTAAVEGKTWREGAIALQLVAEFGLSAREIAVEINARAPSARVATSERWVQRLIEVQRVFPTSESRVASATWKNHGAALDLARISMRFEGVHVRSLSDVDLANLAVEARGVLVDALESVGRSGMDADRWLDQRRAEIRSDIEAKEDRPTAGADRGPVLTRSEGATLGDGLIEDEDGQPVFGDPEAWKEAADREDEGWEDEPLDRAFQHARSAIIEFLEVSPTKAQINTLLAMLRDARRKAE